MLYDVGLCQFKGKEQGEEGIGGGAALSDGLSRGDQTGPEGRRWVYHRETGPTRVDMGIVRNRLPKWWRRRSPKTCSWQAGESEAPEA